MHPINNYTVMRVYSATELTGIKYLHYYKYIIIRARLKLKYMLKKYIIKICRIKRIM